MNELIKTNQINYHDLVTNSNPDESLNFKSRMVEELTKEFSTKEQQWFIANLYMYLNYHPTDEFPINLDDAWKIIGFKNKGNAKKKLETNFILDEDYTIALLQTQKRKNEGGHNKETVMLNMDTFKNLCMISNTPEGKQIRKYYIKLENVYNKVIQQDHKDYQKQLESTQKLLSEKEEMIDNLNSEISWSREQGHVLYAFHTGENKYKCGTCKSENLDARRKLFRTSNPHGDMIYTVKVKDDYMERIMHHIMKQKLVWIGGEVFDGNIENIKSIMDIVCKFEILLVSTDVSNMGYLCDNFTKMIDSNNLEYNTCIDFTTNQNDNIEKTIEKNKDPEITVVSKSKRSVDQVDKITDNVVATYSTLTAAGYAMRCSGEAIGIAVRNRKACKGYNSCSNCYKKFQICLFFSTSFQ
jgi:phage anti-repressor protein